MTTHWCKSNHNQGQNIASQNNTELIFLFVCKGNYVRTSNDFFKVMYITRKYLVCITKKETPPKQEMRFLATPVVFYYR